MDSTKTNLGKFEYLQVLNALYWEWNENTQKASWEEMQKAMIEYAEAAEFCKAAGHIINEKNQRFTFVPKYQVWIDQNISPRTIGSGCKKFALIKSDNIFKEIAVQQIFREENSSKIQLKIFNTLEEAKKWLSELQ